MRTFRSIILGGLTAAAAGSAWAGPDEAYTVVPPAERLTVAGVVADAAPEVQLMMTVLAVATLAAVTVWAMSLRKLGQADAKGLAGALGRLRIVRSGGAMLGFLTASYVLFSGFLGIANVRPVPSVTVLAPGLAEAMLAVMLGLLASTVAVICERHLEGRIRRAAA